MKAKEHKYHLSLSYYILSRNILYITYVSHKVIFQFFCLSWKNEKKHQEITYILYFYIYKCSNLEVIKRLTIMYMLSRFPVKLCQVICSYIVCENIRKKKCHISYLYIYLYSKEDLVCRKKIILFVTCTYIRTII